MVSFKFQQQNGSERSKSQLQNHRSFQCLKLLVWIEILRSGLLKQDFLRCI